MHMLRIIEILVLWLLVQVDSSHTCVWLHLHVQMKEGTWGGIDVVGKNRKQKGKKSKKIVLLDVGIFYVAYQSFWSIKSPFYFLECLSYIY